MLVFVCLVSCGHDKVKKENIEGYWLVSGKQTQALWHILPDGNIRRITLGGPPTIAATAFQLDGNTISWHEPDADRQGVIFTVTADRMSWAMNGNDTLIFYRVPKNFMKWNTDRISKALTGQYWKTRDWDQPAAGCVFAFDDSDQRTLFASLDYDSIAMNQKLMWQQIELDSLVAFSLWGVEPQHKVSEYFLVPLNDGWSLSPVVSLIDEKNTTPVFVGTENKVDTALIRLAFSTSPVVPEGHWEGGAGIDFRGNGYARPGGDNGVAMLSVDGTKLFLINSTKAIHESYIYNATGKALKGKTISYNRK